jgi:CMP-N-acetylneuraminic acid synthetase
MRILAVVPARCGSKRLPNKNMMDLDGKPLIQWTLESVEGIEEVCDIMISTDCPEIAELSSSLGGWAPWLRPSELATDEASSVQVALHALNWYEEKHGTVNGLLLLQPTSPFRRKSTIVQGIKTFKDFNYMPVIGVSESESHPQWCLKQEDEFLVPFMSADKGVTRFQDLTPSFSPNGTFFLVSPQYLREEKSLGHKKSIPLYVSSKKEAIDIDTESDFLYAQYMVNQGY